MPEISPLLIPIALFYLLCALVSMAGNIVMVVCFLKERKFNSPCHYLITLTCIADMLHLCGHFVFNFQLFYQGPGSQELCFWLLLPSTIGLLMSGPLLLSMGIDRLIACQLPVFYRQLCSRPSFYLCIQLSFPIIYTSYITVISFLQRDSETMVICQVPLAMSGNSFELFNQGGLLINVAVVLIYFTTYIKLKKVTANASQLKTVFKSILYTVIFVILGWCTVTVVNIGCIHLVENIENQHIISIYAGIGLNLACVSNVFVFYTINSEYRSAIRKLIGKVDLAKIKPTTSIVKSTTRQNMSGKY